MQMRKWQQLFILDSNWTKYWRDRQLHASLSRLSKFMMEAGYEITQITLENLCATVQQELKSNY